MAVHVVSGNGNGGDSTEHLDDVRLSGLDELPPMIAIELTWLLVALTSTALEFTGKRTKVNPISIVSPYRSMKSQHWPSTEQATPFQGSI